MKFRFYIIANDNDSWPSLSGTNDEKVAQAAGADAANLVIDTENGTEISGSCSVAIEEDDCYVL